MHTNLTFPAFVAAAFIGFHSLSHGEVVKLEKPRTHGGFFAYAISPDGSVVAGGTGKVTMTSNGRKEVDGCEVLLWDAKTGKLRKTLGKHKGTVNSLQFSADGSVLISGSDEGDIKVWDGKTGASEQAITLPGELGRSSNGAESLCALSGDGKTFAALAVKKTKMGDMDVRTSDTLTVWDVATGRIRWQLADSNVQSLALSTDGKSLAAMTYKVTWTEKEPGRLHGAHSDYRIVAWDAATGKERWGVVPKRRIGATMKYVEGQGLIALEPRQMAILNPDTGEVTEEVKLGTKKMIRDVSFSADGRQFVAIAFMGDMIEWGETATGKITARQEVEPDRLWNPALSSDLKKVAATQKFNPMIMDLTPEQQAAGR